MTHRAETVLTTVLTKVTGLTTTGSNAFRGRSERLEESKYPAVLVFMGADDMIGDYSQDVQDWLLEVFIEARATSATAQLETTLNKIREEVTIALQQDYTQGQSFIYDTLEGGADRPELTSDGAKPVGTMRMTWRFKYRRSRTNPGA